jgi:hypothetical protein
MNTTDDLLDERVRLAVPRHDDSDWRDVRRRARTQRAPIALAAAAILAILIAGPAFALRHQIEDLWTSAEPAKNLYVLAYADCGQGPFTLEFDPAGGAVVRQGGETLATASVTDRRIECDARIHTVKGTPDEDPYQGGGPWRASYVATTVSCESDAALQVAVNPIWDEHGKIVGSSLLVAERATRDVIASAVVKEPEPTASPGTARTYYADVCRIG